MCVVGAFLSNANVCIWSRVLWSLGVKTVLSSRQPLVRSLLDYYPRATAGLLVVD
jgi:hypothetical protein